MKILVNVYTHARDPRNGKDRSPLVLTYTRYQGSGACEHEVDAPNGTEAKRIAALEHRARCLRESVAVNGHERPWKGATDGLTHSH